MRSLCRACTSPVLIAEVYVEHALAYRLNGNRAGHGGLQVVVAEPYEWEPRARCYACAKIESRGNVRANCDRCGGVGYVGSKRPNAPMLAVDVGWSDEGHVRLVGPRTDRRQGEALYALHKHDRTAIVAPIPERLEARCSP